jgi:hypothetical protein
MAIITYNELADYCELPIEYLAAAGPAFCEAQLRIKEAGIYNRLGPRYDTPFDIATLSDLAMATLKGWEAALIAPSVLVRRGVDPTDSISARIYAAAQVADDQIAATQVAAKGAFDLPLRESTKRKAVIVGRSDQNPHTWIERQGALASREREDWDKY